MDGMDRMDGQGGGEGGIKAIYEASLILLSVISYIYRVSKYFRFPLYNNI